MSLIQYARSGIPQAMSLRSVPEQPPRIRSVSLPAPVKGWNTRDNLSDMKDDYAIILDNWFPLTDRLKLRRGHAEHATGIGSGAVESLLDYNGLTANKLFAVGNSAIYDVTSAGAVGAAAVSGLTNNRFQHVKIGTSGGQFLFACNGADTPQTYDGTSWANTTLTGPTTANLIWCNLHQRRLWVGEKNSLSAWYGAVNAITGAFTEFPLYGIASRGGFIQAMGTWTRDGGDGMDDLAVFATSEGEYIIYQGTDPSAAATWSLLGVFRLGKPIGRRCLTKAGSDLIVITEDGYVALSQVISLDRSQVQAKSLSDQINKTVNANVRDYGSNFGWQPFIYPRGPMVIFNVPVTVNTEIQQHVFNAITGAPARFTGINANCFGSLNDEAYIGGIDGTVYKFDSGVSDDSNNIVADVKQAFSYFGSRGRKKRFTMARPVFAATARPMPALDLNVDYADIPPTSTPSFSSAGDGIWDTSLWDTGKWASEEGNIWADWQGVAGVGHCAALRVRVTTNAYQVALMATDFIFEEGGMV
ncbi:MAG: hypothetical protein NUW01_05600 [Gemmatimonadaceae bacterium]|nr:hypothetical protein [Gemmatimonadaceae bacterium]